MLRDSMSQFEKQNKMAEEILTTHRGRALAVVKATRAGATTSLLKVACELGQKTVIVAPYIEIFEKTVSDVGNLTKDKELRITRIPANREACPRIKNKIEKHPSLEGLQFHFRPSCKNCNLNNPDSCELQNILNSEWDVLGLTYSKLRALCISDSKTASDLLAKVKDSDNLILDELVTGIITSAPSLEIENPHTYLEKEFDYSKRLISGSSFEAEFWAGVAEFAIMAELNSDNLQNGEHLIYENTILDEFGDAFIENFAECWQMIEQLTIEGKDTELLQQIVQIISARRFLIYKKNDRVRVTPVEELTEQSARGSAYLRKLIEEYFSEDKLVALVDASLPDINLSETLGVKVERYLWGDPLETNKSQMIICDTRKIGETRFFRNADCQKALKFIINFASEIHKPEAVLIVTMNSRMAKTVLKWGKLKEIPENVEVTYYRSELSRGITIDTNHRILILIGAPYLPKIAYLAETLGGDKMNAFRKSDMKSAFINLIGRVKDPMGKEKSVVFAMGITASEVEAFVGQKDIPSPLIARFPVQGADATDFMYLAGSFLHAHELTEKWKNIEQDLPILERIQRLCVYRNKSLTLSEILPQHTKRLQEFVESYPEVLKNIGISVSRESRGYRLTPHSES